jgi:hypothetical protein
MKPLLILIHILLSGSLVAGITVDPTSSVNDISIDTLEVGGITYNQITVENLDRIPYGNLAGVPCLPYRVRHFVLPPSYCIENFSFISFTWDTLPGQYYVYPAQTQDMEDSAFVFPDSIIYSSSDPYPSNPLEVISQGSMMGFGVVSIAENPIRYIPSDSLLLVLSGVQVTIQQETSTFNAAWPERENTWSAERRYQGIKALVENTSDVAFYNSPNLIRQSDDSHQLIITEAPSLEGDGVDFVIITTEAFDDSMQTLADLRTSQGIISVVRTLEWIEGSGGYSGCDTQERIKNFIIDAQENWGTQAILLVGDAEIIPPRYCESTYYPADDYYADIDGDWSHASGYWEAPDDNRFVDIQLGRWPVDNSSDVSTMLNKLDLYEDPSSFPSNFARKVLFIGGSSSGENGDGAEDLDELVGDLEGSGASGPSGTYLDAIKELYHPPSGHTWSGDSLCRDNALTELDSGYNIVIHADHSGTHQIGAAQTDLPGQYIYEFDIANITNDDEPSILWTLGCWPGHYEGAECFVEFGLLSSDEEGLVAAIAFARSGWWGDEKVHDAFCDGLYAFDAVDNPLCYLGEVYRHSMNATDQQTYHLSVQHLFGDPTMFVWRGNASTLQVSVSDDTVSAGTFTDTVTVQGDEPALEGAQVCLWLEDEMFAIDTTDSNGKAIFTDVEVSGTGTIEVTATMRQTTSGGISNYQPGSSSIVVTQSSGALVTLDVLGIDDDASNGSAGNDDKVMNPGETIELNLQAINTGSSNATNCTATLSIVSGDTLVAELTDSTESLGSIHAGDSTRVPRAFCFELEDDISSEAEPLMLEVSFDYDQGSWDSPSNFRIFVNDVVLPIRPVTAEHDSSDNVQITVSEILGLNQGLGGADSVEVEFSNPIPSASFTGDSLIYIGALNPDGWSVSSSDTIGMTLASPSGYWADTTFADCYFDLVATDRWGKETTYTIDVEDVCGDGPDSPSDVYITHAETDWFDLEWSSVSSIDGYYVYYKPSDEPTYNRLNAVPLPVRYVEIDNLTAGTNYDVAVSCIDDQGQEGSRNSATVSTVCTVVSGWPVQIDGSPGTGPVVTDIDGDPGNEVIVASSHGHLYIIESSGSSTLIDTQDYLLTGVAVGDVYDGGRDEIIVSGWDIDNECAVVLVYDYSVLDGWDLDETIQADDAVDGSSNPVGEQIHEYLSSPVIFQANESNDLEIALRTFGASYENSDDSWLYVWKYNSRTSSWEDYAAKFPVCLDGGKWEYPNPVFADDLDNDGSVELLASSGTENIACIEVDASTASDTTWDLGSSLPSGDWNLGSSTMALAEEDSETYLVGFGRDGGPLNGDFVLFCWDPVNESMHWYSGTRNCLDVFGNFGGPAIGNIDGGTDLEIVKIWGPSSLYSDDACLTVMDLDDGSKVDAVIVPDDPRQEDNALSPVTCGGSSEDGNAIFYGFSTKNHAYECDSGDLASISGFPGWSKDGCLTAPVIANLDADEVLEVLASDASGVLTLFDWDGSTSSAGWPMFQHDITRTGNYEISRESDSSSNLDFEILSISRVVPDQIQLQRNDPIIFLVDVLVIGDDLATSIPEIPMRSIAVSRADEESTTAHSESIGERDRFNHRDITQMEPIVSNDVIDLSETFETVQVAVTSGNCVATRGKIPLIAGVHTLRLILPTSSRSGEIGVVVDPDQEYIEIDENNNIGILDPVYLTEEQHVLTITNPIRGVVEFEVLISETVNNGYYASLYTLDGRLVLEESDPTATAGLHQVRMSPDNTSTILPNGFYVLKVSVGNEELTRPVVVLR